MAETERVETRVGTRSDPLKVAGFIAGRLREGRSVHVEATGGAVWVLVQAVFYASAFLGGPIRLVSDIPRRPDGRVSRERVAVEVEAA